MCTCSPSNILVTSSTSVSSQIAHRYTKRRKSRPLLIYTWIVIMPHAPYHSSSHPVCTISQSATAAYRSRQACLSWPNWPPSQVKSLDVASSAPSRSLPPPRTFLLRARVAQRCGSSQFSQRRPVSHDPRRRFAIVRRRPLLSFGPCCHMARPPATLWAASSAAPHIVGATTREALSTWHCTCMSSLRSADDFEEEPEGLAS